MTWLHDILTGPEGKEHEPANYIAIFGAIGGLVIVGHQYFWRGATFDLQAFGIGLAAIVAALGAAQRLRGDADPPK